MKYKHTKEYLEEAVKKSLGVAGVCRELNIRPSGGNYKTINDKIKSKSSKKFQPMENPKYLLLIWNIRFDQMNPYLLTAFESDFEFTEIHKGHLADTIEKVLNIKISTDDFDYEPISFDDFMDEYGNPKNPNRVLLCETHKF